MSNSWWIRVGVILFALLWSVYTLTPTFLAESAEQRLARKAEEAKVKNQNEKTDSQILEEEIKERIPAATELPLWLKKDINEAVFDCKASCTETAKTFDPECQKDYASAEDGLKKNFMKV